MFASAEKSHVNGKARSINRTATKAARHVEDDADDAISTIYSAASAIKGDVESLANTAGRRVRKVIDEAQVNVSEATDSVTAAIREKPFQSGAILLGLGAVIGFLMRGRS